MASSSLGAAFTPGDLAIYRVGDGAGSLSNTGAAVFIDEYTTTGTLVQSIALPSVETSGMNLIASGTATSEGLLNRSPDGSKLVVTGYNRAVGGTGSVVATTAATVNRVAGVLDASANVSLYGFNDWASTNNPRSAIVDGNSLYVTGAAGGVRYADLSALTPGSVDNVGTQISSTVTNLRATEIYGGQLYVSTSSGSAVRVGAVGTGTPTASGETITNLPGFPTSGSPYGFFAADLDAGVEGVDTLYVASDDSAGLTKYSLVAGSWTSNGVIGVAADAYRGLTASIDGSTVTLFATRKGGSAATGGGELVALVDASGYNGAFAGDPTVLAAAAANTSFRGVDFVPVDAGMPSFLASDYNQDAQVDDMDLATWQTHYGTGTTNAEGDGTGDMAVDGADFLLWQQQFGQPQPQIAAAVAAVPEPACWTLICGGLAGASLAVRRRR